MVSTRPMKQSDVKLIVHIHLQAFPNFFLTFLGPSFLRELYSAILADTSGIGFVTELEDKLLGFVIGTDNPTNLYTRLLRQRWWNFAKASLGAFVRKPGILPRLLRAFAMPGQKTDLDNYGTLMSIAVLPESQGKKIGQMLVKAFLDEATHRGLKHVNLTTDLLNNEYANHFYEKLGFSLLRHYSTPEGRQMNEYVFALCPVAERKE